MFIGFDLQKQAAVSWLLTTDEVVYWDSKKTGEVVFRPVGDNQVMLAIFERQAVTSEELKAICGLLGQLQGDQDEKLLRILFAVDILGFELEALTIEDLEAREPCIFSGKTGLEARAETARYLLDATQPYVSAFLSDASIKEMVKACWNGFIQSELWSSHELTLRGDRVIVVLLHEE